MKEIINFITNRPMEAALWLLLALGIAFFLWICWRNIQRGRRERINKIIFLALAMMAGQTAMAQTNVTSSTTTMTGGTYRVTANVTIESNISVTGNVTLVIDNGKTLTASNGFTISSGKTLTVQGQGTLTVNAADGAMGERGVSGHQTGYDGGNGSIAIAGNVMVNGGTVTVTGGNGGMGGMGSSRLQSTHTGAGNGGNGGTGGAAIDGSLIVFGGTVTVTGGNGGKGGDGGGSSTGSTPSKGGNGSNGAVGITGSLTVNGGTVNVAGGSGGSAGHGGWNSSDIGNSGGQGAALGGTVICNVNSYVIRETNGGNSWKTIASGSTCNKRYLKVYRPADGNERTVTYTFTRESVSGQPEAAKLIFTPSGDQFGTKSGEKTAIIQNTSNSTGFTVELDDGVNLRFYRNSGLMTFSGNDGIILNYSGNNNSRFTLTCSDYYIRHIRFADKNGNAFLGTGYPAPTYRDLLDVEVEIDKDNSNGKDPSKCYEVSSVSGSATFGSITITLGDKPHEYDITYVNAIDGKNGVTNTNPTSYNFITDNFNVTAPTRTGYTIGDVTYADAQQTSATAVTLPQTIAKGDALTRKDIIYNFSWTANTYSVQFNKNATSATGEMDDQTFTYDIAQPLSDNDFTRTGYTFTGWSTDENGDVVYTNGQSVSNLTADNGATINLYAQWTVNTYTVRFHKNDGGEDEYTDQAFTYDIAQALTANSFSRTGYTFAGWNTQADGNGSAYSNQQSVSNLTATNGATIDLYAQWTTHTYAVEFLKNADSATGEMSNQSFTYDAAKALTSNAFSRTGYTFMGWNTQADGNGTSYDNGESVSNLTDTDGATVTLYAQWKAHTYTVHFDGNYDNNGIPVTGTMEDMVFAYDQPQNLTLNNFEREGYRFYYWTLTPQDSGDHYYDGQSVCNLTAEDNDVVTLYLQWGTIGWGGDGRREDDPITLKYPSQLLLLAKNVNSGEYDNRENLFVTLENDIDMKGINFSGFGTLFANGDKVERPFRGNFDGGKKTIRNLTINHPDKTVAALFLYLKGTVKNLKLDNAQVTGGQLAGVLTGGNNLEYSFQNCLVQNSSVTLTQNKTYGCGIISGEYSQNAPLTDNYYLNCRSTVNGETYTRDIGTKFGDMEGACGLYTLTVLDDNVYAEVKNQRAVYIDGKRYIPSGAGVTLYYEAFEPAGYHVEYVSYDFSIDPHAYWFKMPSIDATVYSIFVLNEYDKDVTIDANEYNGKYWTTFSHEMDLKINDDENAVAYTATVDGNKLMLHKLGKVIPSGTGVIIVSDDSSISLSLTSEKAEYSVPNDLRYVTWATRNDPNFTYYVLGKKGDNFGFFHYTGLILPPNKAILEFTANQQARELEIVFEDEATSLSEELRVKSEEGSARRPEGESQSDDAIYNLSGQKLNKPQKGINIINGRKVLY